MSDGDDNARGIALASGMPVYAPPAEEPPPLDEVEQQLAAASLADASASAPAASAEEKKEPAAAAAAAAPHQASAAKASAVLGVNEQQQQEQQQQQKRAAAGAAAGAGKGPLDQLSTMYAALGPLEVTISATRMSETKPQHTIYVILVKWKAAGGKEGEQLAWTVSRRFSQFDNLRRALSLRVSNLQELPPKTWFRILAGDFVAERKRKLEMFLHDLLQNPAVLHSREFLEFLEVPANVQLERPELPRRLATIADTEYGINDFAYDHDHNLLITGCEDVNALSYLDAKLSNLKFPWEKKGQIVPVGSFTLWVRDGNVWEAIATEYTEPPVTAVAWDARRKRVYVGCGDGALVVYDTDLQKKLVREVRRLDLHAGRVTEVTYHPGKDVVLTCSRDKTMHMLSVENDFSVLTTNSYDRAWLSSLAFDVEANKAFVGTYDRGVAVFNLARNPAPVEAVLSGHSGSVRCVHFVPGDRYMFTGGFDNLVGVWKLPDPGQPAEKTRSVGWLAGGPPSKIKAITYSPENSLVVAGHACGRIAIWDVLEAAAELLFVLEAHAKDVVRLGWMDHRVLISGGRDGDAKFWRIPQRPASAGAKKGGAAQEEKKGDDGGDENKVPRANAGSGAAGKREEPEAAAAAAMAPQPMMAGSAVEVAEAAEKEEE